jgi:hypothetical protein
VDVDPKDYTSAACADALVEGLTLYALQAAHDVADSPEEFFWAVQGAILLKETCDANT